MGQAPGILIKLGYLRQFSMWTGRKLGLTLAFTVLIALAAGVSCRGFFQPNTLETVTLQPPSLNIGVGLTQQFTAYGTYEDNSRTPITSGVVWTSSDPTDVPITAGGLLTAVNVTSEAVTITGSAQGLSATSSVSVVGDVTSITGTESASSITANGSTVTFTFAATPGPPAFITADNGGTLNITTADSSFTCTVGTNADGDPAEVCSLASGGTATQYQLQMSYPSSSGSTVNSNVLTINAVQ
jgi:hypothetical protein